MSSVEAFLDDYERINVTVSRDFYHGLTDSFYLTSGREIIGCEIEKTFGAEEAIYYTLKTKRSIQPNEHLVLNECHGHAVPVRVRWIVRSERFRKQFQYDGPIGAHRIGDECEFVMYAPSAEWMVLLLETDGHRDHREMVRHADGSFKVRIPWREGQLYRYLLYRDGGCVETIDPHGLSSNANGEWSATVDEENLIRSYPRVELAKLKKEDIVIYETSVRDFTSHTSLKDHGKFSGFEKKIEHLKRLGITHVQLQPVMDFATVDELHPIQYNWGYDPLQYFAPEGSYSSDPDDPLARVHELAHLVQALHNAGIRVVLDVVYNHVYNAKTSSLHRLLPYYAFRYYEGRLANGTGCGNDVDSEAPMVRRLIKDSLCTLVNLYDVDGFRFDLMGILDIETMNECADALRKLKPSILLYGEGWNMMTPLSDEKKAMLSNQDKLNGIGMFNDRFRDEVKGGTADDCLDVRGYCTGDLSKNERFIADMLRQADLIHYPMDSINAVETHDNGALRDQLKRFYPDADAKSFRNRYRMLLAATIFSSGIPFLHSGMEFMDGKDGNTNSYNAGDEINGLDWTRENSDYDQSDWIAGMIEYRVMMNDSGQMKEAYPLHNGAVLLKCGRYFLVFNPGSVPVDFGYRDGDHLVTGDIDPAGRAMPGMFTMVERSL